jgi:hypothetical protein
MRMVLVLPAVRAGEGMDLTGADLEIKPVERDYAAISLDQSGGAHHRSGITGQFLTHRSQGFWTAGGARQEEPALEAGQDQAGEPAACQLPSAAWQAPARTAEACAASAASCSFPSGK